MSYAYPEIICWSRVLYKFYVARVKQKRKELVSRYFVWPGQATSYKIGMLKILELRSKAEEELGDRFDIRGFHDTILGAGAVTLPIMERLVDNWIEKLKRR